MKNIFVIVMILSVLTLSAQSPVYENVSIENYSPMLILKRTFDGGGYVQGIQSRLKDNSDNWFMGNFGTEEWMVSKGDWQNRKLSIHANGNIGIGTNVPDAKLQVGDNSGAGILLNSRLTSVEPKIGAQIFWSESSPMRTAGDLIIAPRTDIASSVAFYTNNGSQIDERMIIRANGFIGIGSKNPDAELTVKGKIHAQEIKVDLAVPADYVFQKYYTGNSILKSDYRMLPIEDLGKFTEKNHHLPNIPSAGEIQANGFNVSEMSNLLLEKIEELTLYSIEQNKEIKQLQEENKVLKLQSEEISELKRKVQEILSLKSR